MSFWITIKINSLQENFYGVKNSGINSRACRVLDHDPKSLCLLWTKVIERAQRGFWTCQKILGTKLKSDFLR